MGQTPNLTRVHHITFSVTELDRSLAWYRDVLGFTEVKRLSVGGLDKAMMVRDELVLTFVAHGDQAVPGPFDERRAGLDHLSFAVPDVTVLRAWVAHLDSRDVDRGDITKATTGHLVAFRDPDNIALEFYTLS